MLDENSAGLELAVARWLLYLSSFLLIGAGGARLVVARAIHPSIDAIRATLFRRLRFTRLGGAILLAGAAGVMLVAQVHSWFGPGFLIHRGDIGVMLAETHWGMGWTSMVWMSAALVVLGVIAIAVPRVDWIAGALVAAGAATAVPLTGHGAAHGAWLWWTHATHVFGGSLWLGTLAVLVPVTWTLWRPASPAPPALHALLARFTPVAMTGAAIALLSGTVLTAEHLVSVSAALSSDYGRTLLVKLTVVLGLAAIGWLNWRSARGPIDDPRARRALRSRAVIESAVAVLVVLAVTAILAGLAPTE
jgi:copper transport protein